MKVLTAALLLAVYANAVGAEIQYVVQGVDDPLATNVRSHVTAFQVARPSGTDGKNVERLVQDATNKAREALRPYGYYAPEIDVNVEDGGDDRARVVIDIQPGPPVIVEQAVIELAGDGAAQRKLIEWKKSWPLRQGKILDQTVWQEQKQDALYVASSIGYLDASYTVQRLELDLEHNRAVLRLTLDTGRRYVFGDVEFGEHMLKPGIVEFIPRFAPGEPYNRRMLDRFRLDLWKSGYFTNVEVQEIERPQQSPPAIDLKVNVETGSRNYYQGSVGVGSDTGARLQAQWSKHPMSSSGDRIDVGIGWQERDDEISLRGAYRLPRRNRARQYWVTDAIFKNEALDLEIKRRPEDENFVQIANGRVDELHLRAGRLKVRNFKQGEKQAFETLFVQLLNGERELVPEPTVPDLAAIAADPQTGRFLKGTDNTISLGFDYDLVAVYGKGWETKGHRERGWVFSSSTAIGSDVDFTQVYLSTRRSYLHGDRWKFIVRAEAGFTDAAVDDFTIDVNGEPLDLSVTRLPNFYRFKAGGSNSVRGYGFEELSNNLIGSNHIITASAELEMKFLQNWSAAVFVDIGNAFNDWERPELRKGAGIGFRWYSIAGPIRVDFARALDIDDSPWRLHFTIGSPLL